ncbi:MAG: hypothetical protein JWQ35_60 [Bacteriovoracaceae bacterium]|nr:hypothetical protein [Bacteriovoracaceae bacterium]
MIKLVISLTIALNLFCFSIEAQTSESSGEAKSAETCATVVKKVAYYAHPISIYGSAQEKRDVALIESLGFEVLNPNAQEHDRGYKEQGGMAYFEKLIRDKTHLLFFRAFADGTIPAGVAKEIEVMNFGPVIELPTGIKRRTLSVDVTREVLKESGAR